MTKNSKTPADLAPAENSNMQKAQRLARGSYQRALVAGETRITADLEGKAKNYSGRYEQSAKNLIHRLVAAGVEFVLERGPRGGWHSTRIKVK